VQGSPIDLASGRARELGPHGPGLGAASRAHASASGKLHGGGHGQEREMVMGLTVARFVAGWTRIDLSRGDFEEGVRDLHRTTKEDGVFCYTFFKACSVSLQIQINKPDLTARHISLHVPRLHALWGTDLFESR
jgi:hypothetical protein